MPPSVVQESPEGVLLHVHVQPKAARTEEAGLHGGALKIRVAAPPVGGAANEELCRYLASCLGLPRNGVEIRAGHGARRKRVLLKHVSASRVVDVFKLAPGSSR